MLTEERNPRTTHIDQLSTLDILQVMNDEDSAVTRVVRNALPQIALAVDAIVQAIERGGRLIYVGAGTSGRLGVLDAAECVPTFNTAPGLVIGVIAGGQAALTRAVEGAEDRSDDGERDLSNLNLTAKDVVIGIAASGRTPYVLGAMNAANQLGAVTAGIACNVPSALLDVVHIPIGLPVGPEVITGSTRLKAGTAQKMVLNMLSTTSMVRLGKVYGNLMVDVQITNEKLAHRAERITAEIADVTIEEARRLLHDTGSVKAAVLVHLRGITADEAQARLEQTGGRLRDALELS